ncbi:PREDICTED: defensin-like protein 49 [Camelina sativa]|uniref:Defensin-like protein 49 n=1 Tax=Camelina sativa TaxID=90675 RepID=A0ABM0XYU8_CAMSA|nr:PREDICTED: defensin-like protein 49 [Camelina sativa]
MGITKALVIFFHIVILAVSLSNHVVLTSGAEIEKFTYDHCYHLCVQGEYGSRECFVDCTEKGFYKGDCVSRTPTDPIRCCCNDHYTTN